MEKTIILNAEITGYLAGEQLSEKYRMVMVQRDNKWSLCPEQSFQGEFNEYSRLPGWCLSSLLQDTPHVLFIDFGQRWCITGVDSAVEEAVKHV